jgi:hypothetical protein
MNTEPIHIAESEAKEIGPRQFETDHGLDSHFVLQMQTSPKTDQIQRGTEVIYKGMRYKIARKGDIGTPGEMVELALLVLGPIQY